LSSVPNTTVLSFCYMKGENFEIRKGLIENPIVLPRTCNDRTAPRSCVVIEYPLCCKYDERYIVTLPVINTQPIYVKRISPPTSAR